MAFVRLVEPPSRRPSTTHFDALEAAQFWQQAEAHAAWRLSLPSERKAEIDKRERALDGISGRLRGSGAAPNDRRGAPVAVDAA